MSHRYKITHHVKQRYLERKDEKYKFLTKFKSRKDVPHSERERYDILSKKLMLELSQRKYEIKQEILDALKEASVEKSYLNDSRFMSYYFNKYGYDRKFEFRENDGLLYVVVFDEGEAVVTTCMVSKQYRAVKRSKKYKKNKKEFLQPTDLIYKKGNPAVDKAAQSIEKLLSNDKNQGC